MWFIITVTFICIFLCLCAPMSVHVCQGTYMKVKIGSLNPLCPGNSTQVV